LQAFERMERSRVEWVWETGTLSFKIPCAPPSPPPPLPHFGGKGKLSHSPDHRLKHNLYTNVRECLTSNEDI